ncbi:MAG: sulfatase-like hydrolase/transferase [Acidobacteriota bacterium]|nr:sulfatase-like hydrolase/transferase [Acidobacteriota bacterium]
MTFRVLLIALWALGAQGPATAAQTQERPNILWLSSEDNGPHLGTYGDDVARTPNLDALAARGVRYRVAWSNAPVCAPARTTIITGLYATSLGAHHMRSAIRLPPGFRLFPQLLREAGYYTSNNSKLDYNLVGWEAIGDGESQGVWSESSREAHWRNRPEGAAFFSVFNYTTTHESQIRRRPHQAVQDPAAVRLPAYHPDAPEMRRAWAQYYDKLNEMDAQAGAHLRELDADGLADSTIVFYWGDHGIGLPRGKRTPLDAGLLVPLLVYIPPAFAHLASADYQAGGESQRLVGFVDFAPTVLSLVGIEPPAYYQGAAFLGAHVGAPKGLLFGFRGRMDERFDSVRSVRDGRWVYARNYMPHRSYGEFLDYMFQTPATREWYRLYEEGALPPVQAFFWQPTKPYEELYDLDSDPWEVRNVASVAEHAAVLDRLSEALDRHLVGTRDLGLLHEAEMLARTGDGSPWELARDRSRFDAAALVAAARLAADGRGDLAGLRRLIGHADAALRYWGALGVLVRGEGAGELLPDLEGLLHDGSGAVRITAAEALGRFGSAKQVSASLEVLIAAASLEDNPVIETVAALNAIEALGPRGAPLIPRLRALPTEHEKVSGVQASYVPRLIERIVSVHEAR